MFKKKESLNSSNKTHKKRKRCLMIILISFLTIIIFLISFILNDVYAIFKSQSDEKIVVIPQNSTLTKVSQILYDNDLINNKSLFSTIVKLKGKTSKIKYGTFALHKGMTYDEILNIINNSDNNLNKTNFLIIEGNDFFDINNTKNNIGKFNDLLTLLNDKNIYNKFNFSKYLNNEKLNDTYYPMEGFIQPNTYYIDESTTTQDLVNSIFTSIDKQFNLINDKLKSSNLDFFDIITLASMIEAEAGSKDEMPLISSVFHNRLNNSNIYPKLESDPTRKYAEKIKTDITNKGTTNDLSICDKYNTYICYGLPAGPICNPSIDAINAALNPSKSNYFYFCSDINTKQSFFAETLEQHQQNLKKAGISK